MANCPTATYRFQLTPDFGFDHVVEHFDTLVRLGVSHVYLSPIAEAVTGSQHGYDVVDHTRVRSEFGGRPGLDRLLDAAADHDLGVIFDHVPNHVSVARPDLNPMWWQMLAEGPDSDAAAWFDIEWEIAEGRVIVPQLGRPLDEMIAAGEVRKDSTKDGDVIVAGTLRYPLRSGTEELELAEALEHQHYRLQFWRDAERNVRRFFTIDELVAVRVEDHDVAERVDTLAQELTSHPAFAGVRVDHVDGLADPGDYLDRLRARIGDRLLFVEKILATGEVLPDAWPVEGTTGYEHITIAEHTLLDPAAREPLVRAWAEMAGDASFHDLERTARNEVLDGGLRPDLDRLVRVVAEAEPSDRAEDVTRSAIVLLTLELARYRTYLPDPESVEVFEALVDGAVARADDAALADEVRRVARILSGGSEARTRWQQLTGPVMAKGAEDRAFYRYLPLASLCEVGGTPGDFATPIDAFHRHQIERSASSPMAMLASTTHDTKRSAGVRARSLALAARAEAWVSMLEAWITDHDDTVRRIDQRFVSLAVQTGVTARPLTVDRLHAFLVKSAREGDEISTWNEPDESVEADLRRLAELVIRDADDGTLSQWADIVEPAGAAIGLRLLTLQLTCPGFADLYQGSPMTLLSLVDPDNRVPPSWTALQELVDQVATTDTESAFGDGRFDLARTVLTERVLRLRRRRPAAFDERSGYQPLDVTGDGADDVLAYTRTEPASSNSTDALQPAVVVIVHRALDTQVADSSALVELPQGTWRSILHDDSRLTTGGPTRLSDILSAAGVALLERTDE